MLVDKRMDKAMKDLCPKNNPRYELNYVYIKGDEIVVTDTKRLLVLKSNKEIVKEPVFVNIKNNKKLKSNILYDDYPAYRDIKMLYPDYKLIIDRKFNNKKEIKEDLTLSEIIINIGSITGTKLFTGYFDGLKSMNQIKLNNSIAYWHSNEEPFLITGEYDNYLLKLMVMPLIIN